MEPTPQFPENPYHFCPPGRHRVRIDVSYDGTDFCGWQRQSAQPSIQASIEKAVRKIYGEEIPVIGASRTDSGVHAWHQVAHFDAPRPLGPFDLRYSLQCLLPSSIVIERLYSAPRDFHSIACAQQKTYEYFVLNRKVPTALRRRFTYWFRTPLDLKLLNDYSQIIIGSHDFKSFQTSGTVVESTERHVISAGWSQFDEETLKFSITGTGFLKQMVRNLVGTMIYLAKDLRSPLEIEAILAAKDRRRAGPTAPPEGLFLKSIQYPDHLDIQCQHLY